MDNSRKIFERRSSTVKKKAGELAAIRNVEVCVVCFGPDGDLQVWPDDPRKAHTIIAKYREATKKGSKCKRKEKLDLSDVLETKIKKLEKQVLLEEETKVENLDDIYGIRRLSLWDEKLAALSENSLMGLSDYLQSKVQSLCQKIESLKGKQTVPLMVQNQFDHNSLPFLYDSKH